MDRRYYLAKVFLIAVAIVLALTGGRAGTGMTRALDQRTSYSAAVQVQEAAWHATVNVARLVTCLASHTLQNLP